MILPEAIPAILTSLAGFFKSLGIVIRGKTQHFDFPSVANKANDFAAQVYPQMVQAYGAPAILKLIPAVYAAGLQATYTYWGSSGNTAPIRQDWQDSINRFNAGGGVDTSYLEHALWLYFVFVMWNVDVEMPDTFQPFLENLWQVIFVQPMRAQGLDPAKVGLATITPGKTTPPISTGGTETKANASQLAGFGLVAGVIILGVLFSKKG